ncbi:MAG: DUF484 family protein [Spongiibacteraceae bacterium]|nr:DUF484 family protein [Spongiibacteraceae bacterium]
MVDKEITEENVAQYLKSHSGFFLKRDDLLMELQLAHPSGGAVSLLERQVSLLRERNMDMRSRLNNLLENARNNDQLFDKTRQLVISLLEAQGLDVIVNTFTRGLLSDFSMDFASLTLFGNPQLHRTISSRMVPVDDAYQQIPSLLKSNKTTCGILRPEELRFLFAEQSEHVGSAAVVPLSTGQPLGVIAIGSRDAHYFRSTMGTLFLSYIAEVLNRVLVRYLKLG